ncbi:unnamed protein product [Nippostrongylus brasiliensis]|uniref:TGF_BETA_2 domain-containing protein n=1 Tax=Nippostrongylus brasiliensis TaxID=27835 RepID=A0A0N4Y6T5_NIPBR|nr:unnamed protein product [Nippostrongylus brasiliensis]
MDVLLSLLLLTNLLGRSSTATAQYDSRQLERKVKTMMLKELDLLTGRDIRKPDERASGRKIRDKVTETVYTATPDGVCLPRNKTLMADCFAFKTEFNTDVVSAMITMRRNRDRKPSKLIVALFEVGETMKLKPLGRGVIEDPEMDLIRNLRISIFRSTLDWFNPGPGMSKEEVHRIKIEVVADGSPVPYFDFFEEPPELDLAYYDNPQNDNCDPTVECCLVTHFVNFTEIGWDKFIQYPIGFYANYCIGPSSPKCFHEDPEVQTILSVAQAQSELPNRHFHCAPKQFAPLQILYRIGTHHSMKLILDDMIALSCSCMA